MAINFLGAIIILFGSIIYLIYSLIRCCCCCKKPPATKPLTPEEKKKLKRWEYCRITVSVLALIGVPVVFLLSLFLGNYGITTSSESLTTASVGAKNLIYSLEPGITGLFVSSAATILAPTLSNFNVTLTSAIDVVLMAHAMEDINTTVPLLPNMTRMINSLTAIRYIATNTCQVPLDNLVDLADELVVQNNHLTSLVYLLAEDVDDMKTANHNFLKALTHGEDIIDDAKSIMIKLFGAADLPVTDQTAGLLGSIKTDLNKLQRSPSGDVPSASTFTAASDSSAGSITHLISGAYNNSVSDLTTMNNKLTSIYTSTKSLPNLTTTGNNILKVNQTIHSMISPNGLLDDVTKAINAVSNNISAYPSLNKVYHHLDSLEHLVHDLNISGAVAVMEALVSIFHQVPPQLTILSSELNDIRLLNVILPALESLTDQLHGFNRSIIKLPSTLNAIYDAYDTINKTASDVISQVDDIQDTINTANASIAGYIDTTNHYIELSREEDIRLQDALDSYNLTDYLIKINSTSDTLRNTNFTTFLVQIQKFKKTLSSVSFPKTLSDSLFTLQDSISGMNTLLKRAVDTTAGGKNKNTQGDYLRLKQGYCSNDDTKYCSTNGDCTSATCVGLGSYRCTEHGSFRCNADATCVSAVSSTSYCLADTSRATTLKNYFVAFSGSNIPDFSSYTSTITSLQTSTTLSLTDSSNLLSDALDAINLVNFTTIEVALDDMIQSIKDYNFTDQAIEIRDTIVDTQQEIVDIPILDYIDLLEPFKDDFQSFLDDTYDTIVDVTKIMQTFRNFLFSSGGLRARLQQMSRTNLDSIVVAQGPSAMIDHIAYQFDLMSDYFTETDLGINSPNFTKKSGDKFQFLDKMGAYEVSGFGDMNSNGPNYYLMRLFDSSKTMLSTDNFLSGVFVNKGGERYPGGAYCTIDKCQDHTLDVVNTAPMNEWQDEFPGTDLSMLDSVTYSREELQMYIWAPVIILWFIGVIAFCCHFTMSKCGQNVEKYSAGCYLACICCQLPIIFILTAFLFVLIVMLADGCESYALIGDKYITEYGDPFCHNVFGGNGTLTECVIETDLPNYMTDSNFTVTVNLIGMYRAIFENECPGDGPFEDVFNSIADQLYNYPPDFTQYMINKTNENGQFELRQPIINVAINGTARIGMVLRDYLKEQATTSLTCENIAAIVYDFHQDTCGSIVPPLLWSIGPWYLCAWILCCCSLPSACLLGRDRKHSSIFPENDDHQPLPGEDEEHPEHDIRDEEEAGGEDRGGGRGDGEDDNFLNGNNQVANVSESSL